MELHRFVAWWCAPELSRARAMFLVKLLAPVRQWKADGFTARAVGSALVPVRICNHRSNSGHPAIGQEYLARPRDLIAVQYGHMHN